MAGALRRMQIVVDAEDNATRTLDKIDRKADDVGESMDKLQSRGAMAKKGMLAAGTGALVAAAGFAKLMQFGGKLDRQFGRIAGIGNYTAGEMDKIRTAALRIGQETPLGIGQAASAFEELAKAGYSSQQAIVASKGAADLAIAGQLNMADAVETTVQGIQTFNLAAKNSTTVANTLANVANQSTADVSDLGEAMSYVGASADSVGYSMGETAAAIGVLSDAGQKGSKAGTNLENAIRGLIDPTEKAQGAFKQLGLSTDSFVNRQGNLKDMATIADTLRKRFDKMGIVGAERMKLLTRMFGVRGARAMNVLIDRADVLRKRMSEVWGAQIRSNIEAQGKSIDTVIGRYEKMAQSGKSVKEISKAIQTELNVEADAADYLARKIVNGKVAHDDLVTSIRNASVAADVSAREMKTLGGQWEEFTGTLETIAYQLYREVAPAVTTALTQLNKFLDAVSKSPGTIKLLATALLGLGAALTVATVAFGAFWAYASILSTAAALPAATGAVTSLSGALSVFAATISGGVMAALSALVSILLGPVGIALAVVGAAFVAYKYNVLGFRDAIDVAIAGLQKIVRWFGEVARASMWLGAQLRGPLFAAINVIVGAFQWVQRAIRGVIQWYNQLSPLGKLIVGIFLPVIPVLANVRKAIRLIGPAVDWVRTRWAALEKRFDPMKLARKVARMATQIGKTIRPVIRWFVGFGNRLMIVGRKGGRAFTRLTDALNNKVLASVRKSRPLLTGLIRAFNQTRAAVTRAKNGLVQWATVQGGRALTVMRRGVRMLNAKLQPAYRAAGEAARTASRIIGRAWQTAQRLQTRAIRQIIKWIRQMNTAIKNITGVDILKKLGKGFNWVRDRVRSAKDMVTTLGKALDKLGGGIRWLFGGGKGGGTRKATVKVQDSDAARKTANHTKVVADRMAKVSAAANKQTKATTRMYNANRRVAQNTKGMGPNLKSTAKNTRQAATASRKSMQADRKAVNHLKQTLAATRKQGGNLKQTAKFSRQAAQAAKKTQASNKRTAKNTGKMPGMLKQIRKQAHNIHTNTNQLEDFAKKRNKHLKTLVTLGKRRNKLLTQLRTLLRRQNALLKRIQGILKRIHGTLRQQTGILRRIASAIRSQTGLLRRIATNTGRAVGVLNGIRGNTSQTNGLLRQNISATRSLRGAMQAVANRPVNVSVRAPPRRRMAAGGLVTGPTNALIGEEQEDEAVIPLSHFPSILAKTLGKLTPARGGGGRQPPVSVSIDQSPTVEITASGPGSAGLSERQIRRELEQAMEETQEQTLEQLDDILGLGLRPRSMN